jgi:hypothetical protein
MPLSIVKIPLAIIRLSEAWSSSQAAGAIASHPRRDAGELRLKSSCPAPRYLMRCG